MHDYVGAEQDLKQLIEQYNQTTIAQKACLRLADTAFQACLYNEAANTYCKVYNLDDSLESRSAAAFGAAQASFAACDYSSTEIWLTRYLNLISNQDSPETHLAYLLLGKTQLQLDKRLEAFNAFKLALHGELTYKNRKEIIDSILKCDLDKLDPIQALDILEILQLQGLSSQEFTEALLMKCRILRRIHLTEKALSILNDRFDYIVERQLRAKAYFEIGECYIDTGKIEKAYNCFAKLLSITEPGHLADLATLRLAELALKLNKEEKAIDLCSQVLERQLDTELKQTAVGIMAKAYKKQND